MIFKAFKGKRETGPIPSGPDVLWAYPLHRFVNKEEPFTSWEPPGTHIRPDMYDLCLGAVVGYMLYYYYVLIYKHRHASSGSTVKLIGFTRLHLSQ